MPEGELVSRYFKLKYNLDRSTIYLKFEPT